MQLCEYVFCIGFPLYVPKNGVFGGFEGEDVKKYCLLTPKRHYHAWIRVCWCIACQNRFNGLSSRSVERFLRTKKEIKKLSGNFGYMGRSNPWGDLDQMWLVGRYGGRNHVCNIWWLSVKGCGCGERGKFAFSHWLHASRLQHWSHYRVIVFSRLYRGIQSATEMLPLKMEQGVLHIVLTAPPAFVDMRLADALVTIILSLTS